MKTSLWQEHTTITHHYPMLTQDLEVDVVIIGGGITGLTAAQQLLQSGKKVAILESHQIGGMTTSNSTGNLYIPVQPTYQSIAKKFNVETAGKIAHARQFAIDFIATNVKNHHLSCHFSRRPSYLYTNGSQEHSLNKEAEIYNKMGMDIETTPSLPFNLPFKKAYVLHNQARLNPLQYVQSIAEKLAQQGCHIFEKTKALEISEDKICTVKTKHGSIKCQHIFIATHTPIGFNFVQVYIAPYRSYVLAVKLEGSNYPEGHFWSFDSSSAILSTHAVSQEKPDTLLIAGSHHKTGQDKNAQLNFKKLELLLNRDFSNFNIVSQWSAQHFQSADMVPYIGFATRKTRRVFIATGYFADGLIYGTLAGIIVADIILNRINVMSQLFNATRLKPLASFPSILKENLNVMEQYIKDYSHTKRENLQDIKAGEGCVVKINNEKCAVSRDKNNKLHVVSAICTHLNGVVHWNNAEQTWDCPCHGSRFSPNGEVLEGPAIRNLEKKNHLNDDDESTSNE